MLLPFCKGGDKGPENLRACSKGKKREIYWRPDLGLLAPKPRSLYTGSHFLSPLSSGMSFTEGNPDLNPLRGLPPRCASVECQSACLWKPLWCPFPLVVPLPVLFPALPLLHFIPTMTTIAGGHRFKTWESIWAPEVPGKTRAMTAHSSKPPRPWSTWKMNRQIKYPTT